MAQRVQLLAVVAEEESPQDLVRFAGIVVLGFEADITFLAVTPKTRLESRSAHNLATEILSDWQLQPAAIQKLALVEEWLVRYRMVLSDAEDKALASGPFRPTGDGALERELRGVDGQSFRLRLREGELSEEAVLETQRHSYAMLFLGVPEAWKKIHRIIQFAAPPTLVVRPWVSDEYGFLVCVDGTAAAKRALRMATRIAKVLVAPLEVLAVASKGLPEEEARKELDRAGAYLERSAVPHRLRLEKGSIEPIILASATASTIITLGASRKSQFWQFLRGSMAFRVATQAQGPVLVVK